MHTDPSEPPEPASAVQQTPIADESSAEPDKQRIAYAETANDPRHQAIDLTPGEHGLQVPLANGAAYFNYYWLRDLCSSTIDQQTHERIFDISDLPNAPVARSATVSNGELIIAWKNESHETRLLLSALEPYAFGQGHAQDSAALPRRLWSSGQYPSFARICMCDILNEDESRKQFTRSLIEDGVALVTDMDNSDDALTRLAEAIGPVTPSVDGFYFDVRLTIEPTNLAYTANALELHTDLPNEEAAPGVQFLHCRANSVEGGRSLFVDGATVAEALRCERPEDFELLSSHDIPFFRRYGNWDYRSYQRVIELDHAGNVSGLTVSQHLQDTLDLPQDVLDAYYPALVNFIQMLKQERFMNRFRLSAGECIVFDNHRVVHGREAFSAHSGERHLRGCYVDRAALRSTYRILVRQSCDAKI